MLTLTLFFRNDLYVIKHTGVVIHSITKFIGESQHPRPMRFVELHEELQVEVLDKLHTNEEKD